MKLLHRLQDEFTEDKDDPSISRFDETMVPEQKIDNAAKYGNETLFFDLSLEYFTLTGRVYGYAN
jgi:hypothetical protein